MPHETVGYKRYYDANDSNALSIYIYIMHNCDH